MPGGNGNSDKYMRKSQAIIFVILLTAALSLTSCQTFARAFADQTGRNAADALWDRWTGS